MKTLPATASHSRATRDPDLPQGPTTTQMAKWRTAMSADRTLMSWTRTSLSLQSFGFTLYKVIEGFEQAGKLVARNGSPMAVGLLLVWVGIIALMMGIVEYVGTLRKLYRTRHLPVQRAPFIMAMVMFLLGLFFTYAIISRL
jgi:putative membrane protein